MAIAVYNDAPTALLDYTSGQAARSKERWTRFNSILGFGDLNLAKSLNTVLDWLARVPGKKTMVLVSSGVDTSPPADMQALLVATGNRRCAHSSPSR